MWLDTALAPTIDITPIALILHTPLTHTQMWLDTAILGYNRLTAPEIGESPNPKAGRFKRENVHQPMYIHTPRAHHLRRS
eukprot:7457972-Pyramimonas_sp.AAC.1